MTSPGPRPSLSFMSSTNLFHQQNLQLLTRWHEILWNIMLKVQECKFSCYFGIYICICRNLNFRCGQEVKNKQLTILTANKVLHVHIVLLHVMTFCFIDGLLIISRIMNKDKRFVVLLHFLFCPLLNFWSKQILMIQYLFLDMLFREPLKKRDECHTNFFWRLPLPNNTFPIISVRQESEKLSQFIHL